MDKPLVAVIMGSKSDWETMRHADEMLTHFGVPHECAIVSAHRTPSIHGGVCGVRRIPRDRSDHRGRGRRGSLTGHGRRPDPGPRPWCSRRESCAKGIDSLLSIVQMPGGIPVGTLAIGKAGATNAALLAVAILGNSRPALREKLRAFREEQTSKVRQDKLA